MTREGIKKYRAKMTLLYCRANEFCQKHPEADRNVLVQSWLMLEESPTEKVKFSLLRARAFKPQ